MITYKVDETDKIFETFNSHPSGCFIKINGYKNTYGETADYYLQCGINYKNVVDKSIVKLKDILAGNDEIKSIEIERYGYFDANDVEQSRPAKDRTLKLVPPTTIKYDDPEFQKIGNELLNSMSSPKQTNNTFEKEAKSIYSKDDTDVLYVRECLVTHKIVKSFAPSGQYATSQTTAIKDAIRQLLPISKYRTFRLDRFDSITINGTLIQS